MKIKDIKELELALHRKLLNINNDKRKLLKLKNKNKEAIEDLKLKSKAIDKAYSECRELTSKHFYEVGKLEAIYKKHLALYMSI